MQRRTASGNQRKKSGRRETIGTRSGKVPNQKRLGKDQTEIETKPIRKRRSRKNQQRIAFRKSDDQKRSRNAQTKGVIPNIAVESSQR